VRRALAVCAALVAVASMAIAAPAAQADHIAPTVTATLELGQAVRDCSASGLCARARRATVSWNASCGPAAPPDALQEVDVGIYGVRPDGTRFPYDGEALEAEDATLSGSMGMTAGPGLRFFAQVEVTCSSVVTDAEGNQVEHTGKATSTPTTQFYLPPQLMDFRTTRSGFCGVSVPNSKLDKWLQAGQYAELEYFLRYSARSLMRRGIPELRQVKLFARGAGIRKKASPDRGMLRELGAIGTWMTPRRAGYLKIWATIGGKKTNTLRVRVLPKRC
jgi:hypothetical protein